jgi:hypothetical protein
VAKARVGDPLTTKVGLAIEAWRADSGAVTLILRGDRASLDGHATRIDLSLEVGPLEPLEAEGLGDLLLRAAGWAVLGSIGAPAALGQRLKEAAELLKAGELGWSSDEWARADAVCREVLGEGLEADTKPADTLPAMPTDAELDALIAAAVVCTGISARWCPLCGDCTCRPICPDCGERIGPRDGGGFYCVNCMLDFDELEIEIPRDDPRCPLHRDDSPHGEAAGGC